MPYIEGTVEIPVESLTENHILWEPYEQQFLEIDEIQEKMRDRLVYFKGREHPLSFERDRSVLIKSSNL